MINLQRDIDAQSDVSFNHC